MGDELIHQFGSDHGTLENYPFFLGWGVNLFSSETETLQPHRIRLQLKVPSEK
jgi:hypothetical protein